VSGQAGTNDDAASDAGNVAVLIVSFSSPDTLRRLIEEIPRQGALVRRVLVVDNAGVPPVSLSGAALPVEVVRTDRNLGPAGGWAVALRHFLEEMDESYAWLLDDDVVPRPGCLTLLHSELAVPSQRIYSRPSVHDVITGEKWTYPSWCGPLMPRLLIETAGLPRQDLVWWCEDSEYFQERVAQCGWALKVVDEAELDHFGFRRRGSKRAPQIYYEVRNALWLKLRVRHQYRTPRMWPKVVRMVVANAARAARVRPRRLGLRALALGISDGLRGRLGHRFELAEADLVPVEAHVALTSGQE